MSYSSYVIFAVPLFSETDGAKDLSAFEMRPSGGKTTLKTEKNKNITF